MTDEEARKVVRSVLTELGLDVADPHEMQADFVFVRKQRKWSEKVGSYIATSAIGVVVIGGLYALWAGIKAALNS